MMDHYILDGHRAVPVDMMTWAKWLQTADRTVAKTLHLEQSVSTVFLGLNHQWGDGPPMLFETLVFGGPLDGEMERCSTWEEAEAQHAAMVARLELAATEQAK